MMIMPGNLVRLSRIGVTIPMCDVRCVVCKMEFV